MGTRQFNVFSEMIVLYPNETFDWVVNQAEIGQSPSITVSSSNWPLVGASSYSVTPGTGTSATADNTPGATGTFTCSDPDPNATTQTIVIASQAPVDVCSDVNVIAGDYFIWQNDHSEPVVITPDPENENYWPLPSPEHTVPPNGYLTLLIPTDAAPNQEYDLIVTLQGGGDVCPQAGQPKIVMGSGSK